VLKPYFNSYNNWLFILFILCKTVDSFTEVTKAKPIAVRVTEAKPITVNRSICNDPVFLFGFVLTTTLLTAMCSNTRHSLHDLLHDLLHGLLHSMLHTCFIVHAN